MKVDAIGENRCQSRDKILCRDLPTRLDYVSLGLQVIL